MLAKENNTESRNTPISPEIRMGIWIIPLAIGEFWVIAMYRQRQVLTEACYLVNAPCRTSASFCVEPPLQPVEHALGIEHTAELTDEGIALVTALELVVHAKKERVRR